MTLAEFKIAKDGTVFISTAIVISRIYVNMNRMRMRIKQDFISLTNNNTITLSQTICFCFIETHSFLTYSVLPRTMIRLMILFFLSNILITVCLVFGCWIEPIESVILATRVPYSLNDTICNPSWPLHIVYHPQGGFANSFRALRGLITLALMFNATVTSESYSCL